MIPNWHAKICTSPPISNCLPVVEQYVPSKQRVHADEPVETNMGSFRGLGRCYLLGTVTNEVERRAVQSDLSNLFTRAKIVAKVL